MDTCRDGSLWSAPSASLQLLCHLLSSFKLYIRNRQNVRTAASQRKMLADSFTAAPCGTARHTSCSIFKSGHISKGIAGELTGALGSKIQPNGDSNHHSFPRRRAFVNKSTFDPRSKIKPQSLKIANCMMVNEILWLQ